MAFHEVRFPAVISRGSGGGPVRRTEVVVLGSGFEQRNARWSRSRRRYDAGYGLRNLDDVHEVIAFFEERRGRLHGFRWKDHVDYKSCGPQASVSATDQVIGTGDGVETDFQLAKTYGSVFAPYVRAISKPVSGTVVVAVNGVTKTPVTHYLVDVTIGVVTFQPGQVPANGATVRAGFEFDVPVRFDTDQISVALPFSTKDGVIPNIPVVEIRV